MVNGPLDGVKVLEFAGIGPGPYCGQLLADMGAEVTVVDRPKRSAIALENAPDRRGKKSIIVDLKSDEGKALALDLIATSDALIEGNRPGVMERLGLGPDVCHTRNPALVYGRMTGWGQSGPYAMMAGHDINYLSLTGALQAMGPADQPPFPPLNLVGDFGGGSLFLAMGILAALLEAKTTGQGQVVDAAITDGVNSMMGFFHGLDAADRWTPERGANWLDGAAPYYRCYETSDGKYMAVGCIEPQFLAAMLAVLDLTPEEYGAQHDETQHARQAELLMSIFAKEKQAGWVKVFDGTDACVTPVLSYNEAAEHPHMQARGALQEMGGLRHPAKAPVFSGSSGAIDTRLPRDGGDTRSVLANAGYSTDQITSLEEKGVVRQS
ncbi:carnitine dehydratase [Rhodobacterales bacterium 52_120_T64]|nr:carnitine dehydratase [Rhodobacterales bacterium 52_120_T64]